MAVRNGTPGNDVLVGTAGIDDLSGLGGDDQLAGGKGADDIDGGDGTDTARYDTAASGVSVNLVTFQGTLGDALGDRLFNIENVVGSQFADTIQGDAKDNVVAGLGGGDTLRGGDGSDTVDYAASKAGVKASLNTGIGFGGGDAVGDTYLGIENLAGSAFADELEGDGLANVLNGGSGNDRLFGGGGADTLRGSDGFDTISGGAGADNLDGGGGIDSLDYRSSLAGVQVDLASGKGRFGDAEGDTFASFDGLFGSEAGDGLAGSDASDDVSGEGGNDTILANGGDDRVDGGAGADFMQGGAGSDLLTFDVSSTGVEVDLATGRGRFGDADGDTFAGFGNVSGTTGDDTLLGDDAANILFAGLGDDTLSGRGGDDTFSPRPGPT